jgi:[acyl-carrier-protein] S-malonyltransferase
MMIRLAFIFPGQGSQKVGMGRDFFERYALAREIFSQADSVLGFKLSEICFSGPEDRLKLTPYTQPALLTASYITYKLIEREPDLAAGHSLGEYSALVAAGCLSFEDALRLVHKRGLYMQEAVPVGAGAMAAILGSSYQAVQEAIGSVGAGIVQVANWNSDDQIVIAGHKDAVTAALALLPAARSVMLPVSAPFHSALMKEAEERLANDLDEVEFRDLKFPVITNVDARLIRSGAEARDALKRQVSRPVLWLGSMMVLEKKGVKTVVELGPGKVLLGLLKRISRSWREPPELLHIEDSESLGRCLGALSAAA